MFTTILFGLGAIFLGQPVLAQSTPVQLTVADTSLTTSGRASKSALITIYRNNVEIGAVTANNQGVFSKTIQPIPIGTSDITLRYEDNNGVTSSPVTQNLAFQLQKNTILNAYLPPTTRLKPGFLINQMQMMTFHGSTVPGSIVTVSIDDGVRLFTGTANSAGKYMVNVTAQNFQSGMYDYTVRASIDGDISYPSATASFIIAKPVEQPFPIPDQLIPPDSPINLINDALSDRNTSSTPARPSVLSPTSGTTLREPQVTVEGVADGGSQIILYQENQAISSVFANPDGTWSIEFTATRDRHDLYVIGCFADNCSEPSNMISLAFRSILGSCSIDFSLERYQFWDINVGDTVNLQPKHSGGVPPFTYQIQWGDGATEMYTGADPDRIQFNYRYETAGTYNGAVKVLDDLGCDVTRYFSIAVTGINPGFNVKTARVLHLVVGLSTILIGYGIVFVIQKMTL